MNLSNNQMSIENYELKNKTEIEGLKQKLKEDIIKSLEEAVIA